MESFIKSLFYGDNLGVERFTLPHSKEYLNLEKKENELYEKLKTALSPELFEIFSEFIDTLDGRHVVISEQYYTAGFKTGLRIAMETFNLSDVFET